MLVDAFIDTNILVYAHDRDAGDKHLRAKELIETFWRERQLPCLSVQVLQELHVNLTRKGVSPAASAEVVSRYLSWRLIDNTRHVLQQALDTQQRFQISFWDAMIVAAAQRAGVSQLWTEDLNAGQQFGGVRIVNPLA